MAPIFRAQGGFWKVGPHIRTKLTAKLTPLPTPRSTLWNYTEWATTLQNQQNECAPSEDSDQPEPPHHKPNKMILRPAKTDQPEHSPSPISVFAVRSMGS